MKTRIKKIIILVSALFFVSTGVSLAHDSKRGHHKPQKHAHGYHKKGHDQHFDWHKKHYKHRRHYRDKYCHREVHKVRHYHRYSPREEAIVAVKVKEPGFKFAIVVKEHR